jgi:hypothetical protein
VTVHDFIRIYLLIGGILAAVITSFIFSDWFERYAIVRGKVRWVYLSRRPDCTMFIVTLIVFLWFPIFAEHFTRIRIVRRPDDVEEEKDDNE